MSTLKDETFKTLDDFAAELVAECFRWCSDQTIDDPQSLLPEDIQEMTLALLEKYKS